MKLQQFDLLSLRPFSCQKKTCCVLTLLSPCYETGRFYLLSS